MYRYLLGLLFSFTILSAGSISEDPSFQSIYSKKLNNDKILLMIYTAKTCPQCAYMKKKVFKEKEVHEFMDKHFVVLEKDINKDDLPKGFEYIGIPTMFFIDKNGRQVGKFVGSSRAKPFLKTLEAVAGKR